MKMGTIFSKATLVLTIGLLWSSGIETSQAQSGSSWSGRPYNPDRQTTSADPNNSVFQNAMDEWNMHYGDFSRSFLVRIRKIEKALSAGELDTAERLLSDLREGRELSGPEELYLLRLEANLAILKDDLRGAIDKIEGTLTLADEYLKKDAQVELYLFLFTLQIKTGQLAGALDSFEAANEIDEQDADSPYRETYEMVRTVLAGDQPISMSAQITNSCDVSDDCAGENGQWQQKIFRNTVLVRNVTGVVGSIRVTCGGAVQTYPFEPDLRVQTSGDTGDCMISVFGDVGTGFTFYEIWTNPRP